MMMKYARRYLFAGLLFWVPVWVTFLVIRFIVHLLDQSLMLLPQAYRPEHFGVTIPGLGLIFTIVLLFLTGLVVTNFLGAYLLRMWDHLIGRIPLVRSIYSAVKTTMETMFSSKGRAFRKVLLVEYPRKGMWSLAFQTAEASRAIKEKTQSDMVSIFIPTTPNPTSGFLMMVSKQDVRELDMSIDEALKIIISLGVIQPSVSVESMEQADA